jgi:alanine-glyoxylate transaminase/serine-glyoxylate transaminase/serine-pyruvate transaminase
MEARRRLFCHGSRLSLQRGTAISRLVTAYPATTLLRNVHGSSGVLASSNSSSTGSSSSRPVLMIPGPIEFSQRVLDAMALPTLSHVSPEFIEIFGKALERLRQVFFCEKGQPFVVAGSGTMGWDMAASNLLQPGDKALVVNTGYFGDRFGECLTAYGAEVTHARAAVGDCPTLAEVEQQLVSNSGSSGRGSGDGFKLVTLTHVDTSTAVLTDVRAFAQLIRKRCPNALIVVDGVCATAGEDLRMDEWGIDLVLTASQKAIGVPPGLSILMAGPRAIHAFKSRTHRVLNYFCDWNKWLPIMESYEARKPSYFATPPVNLIRALNVSLEEVLAGGMAKRFAQHRKAGQAMRQAVQTLGLKVVPVRPEIAANTLTAVRFPAGVTGPVLLPAVKKHGAELAGGLHTQIRAEYFRIGHMGISAVEPERGHLEQTIRALEAGLIDSGYTQFKKNAGVDALRAALQ